MCGRYAASANADELVLELEVDEVRVDEPLAPNYNLAPTDPAPIVLTREPRGRTACPPANPRCASCGCCAGASCRAGPRTARVAPG
ncbi:SOS response-associated peptidase family protein [Arsenicicoccus piscis]|uniref:SOS response-associated peptidase family protein n=1 Tax=Arsenicicoccus piscis TaxID=673954 RepID=UPI0024E0526B|nr:SOS response-associated peptidase family protein [Arsenicicoccus piscis]